MNKKEEFNEYLEELKALYEKYPDRALEEAKHAKERIKNSRDSQQDNQRGNILSDIDLELLSIVIVVIIIALLSLFNPVIDNIVLYIFGLAFFLAGFFIGATQKGFGLVFLCSHGMTGLCIMVASFLSPVLSSPLMTENPDKIFSYLGIAITVFLVAIIVTVLINLSDNLKKKRFIKTIALLCYMVGFFLIAILPRIIPFLIKNQLF